LKKPKPRSRVKRDYDPDAVKMKANHVTAEQWLMRHSHCVTVRQVYSDIERTHTDHISYGLGVPHKMAGVDFTPASVKAVCNFPQDGYCGKEPIALEQLADVNARLTGGMKLGSPLLAYVKGEIDLDELSKELNGPKPEEPFLKKKLTLHLSD
jgi:hypothetical protein